jgi:hypothetical protein
VWLTTHSAWDEHQAITKMDSRNLAIVFAPTILRPPDAPEGEENSIAALLGDSLLAHKLMEAFIKNYDDLLGVLHKPLFLYIYYISLNRYR